MKTLCFLVLCSALLAIPLRYTTPSLAAPTATTKIEFTNRRFYFYFSLLFIYFFFTPKADEIIAGGEF